MELIKSFSRSALLRLFCVWFFILVGIDVLIYLGIRQAAHMVVVLAPHTASLPPEWGAWLSRASENLSALSTTAYVSASCLVLVCLFAQWVLIRSLGGKTIAQAVSMAKPVEKPGQMSKAEKQNEDRRKLYHYLGVLQRDGRMLDFFAEDLSAYADDQIGAAVRTIQENCRKSIEKYIAPVPVLTESEGDEITVPEGFDPDEIKLTGNVKGNPPFRGVLRHKGWQAGAKDLPELGKMKNPRILAPAEIEVM